MSDSLRDSDARPMTRRQAFLNGLGVMALGQRAVNADTPADETRREIDNPGATNILYKVVAGNARYRGKEVPFIYCRNDAPTSPKLVGGSSLVYCPPCDFARDASGRPILEISDPVRGGDGLHVSSASDGSKTYYRTGPELADATAKGVVSPTTPVNLAFDIVLHDDLALRQEVWRACLAQLRPIEGRGGDSTGDSRGVELARVLRAVYMLPAHDLFLRCASPGLDTIGAELTKSPMLGDRVPVQLAASARYVNQAYSRAGVLMHLEFAFLTYGESGGFLEADQCADAVVNLLMESQGTGATTATADGKATRVEILTSRQAMDRTYQALRLRGRVLIRAATVEDINVLLGLLQRIEPDFAAHSADQAQAFLDANFDRVKAMNMPGFLRMVKDGKNVEQLTDEEREQLFAEFQASSHRAQAGGGIALGPASLGGGGGGENANSKAWKEQRREQVRKFVSDLHTYTLEGHLPVSPKVDYRVVSTHRIHDVFHQEFMLQRANKGIRSSTLGCGFTTARPTLRPEEGSDIVPDAVEAIDAILRRSERTLGPRRRR